jgi:hypothetical protein
MGFFGDVEDATRVSKEVRNIEKRMITRRSVAERWSLRERNLGALD